MEFKAKCTEVENKEDYFELEISTYKDTIKGRFEMSEIRHLIGILDNSINCGL